MAGPKSPSFPSSEFTRTVTFSPAYDKRNSDPEKNYGIHGVSLRFVLKGPKGATQFVLFTNWQLPHVTEEMTARGVRDEIDLKVFWQPMPADLGYHAYTPQYEGQEPRECDILTDAPKGCYYDGSGLRADDVYLTLLHEGDAGVWAVLEKEYRLRFEDHDED